MTDPIDLDAIYLGKWPRLLVAGQPVTETQANEILVRTDDWHLTGNDREWIKVAAGMAGIEVDEHGWTKFASAQEFRQRHGVLDLHYLDNSRIISSWIGGPKGWCDWDGVIGCTTYNIGKWPDHEEVLSDWRKIAEAFPYLDLAAQLVADEGEDDEPAVGYRIRAGVVEVDGKPTEFIARPDEPIKDLTDFRPLFVGGERGVSLPRLEQALRQVRGG